MKIGKKYIATPIITGIAVAVVLAVVGTVGALNGWFGGGASIPSDTMTRGLVGYWSFDEGNGTTTYDASANSNNGQFMTVASSPKWTSGKVAGALQFDGKDDYVNCGSDSSIFPSGAITLEAWININNFIDSTFVLDAYVASNGYELYLSGTDEIRFTLGDGTGYILTTNDFNLSTATWYHIVAVLDSQTMRIYKNGISSSVTATFSSSIGTPDQLVIGNINNAPYNLAFDGLIDEVRIYNRALSAAEVRYHYNRGGPVAHWKFDEGNGTTTYDSTDNGNDGQLMTVATSPAWTTGKYGTALSFDGTDDYVTITNSSSTSNYGGGVSIGLWFRTNSVNTAQSQFGQNGSAYLNFYMDPGAGYTYLRFETDASQNFTSNTKIYPNTWYYVTGVYDTSLSNNQAKIYINGALDKEATLTFTTTRTADITIGSFDSSSYHFDGLIDDVRIYNYARTPDEIALDYNAGFAARFGPQSSCDEDPGSCMDYGLVGYWNFEEGSGTTTFDNSDYSNDGQFMTAASSPRWTTGIKPLSGGISGGSSLQFDGKDDKTVVEDNSSLDITEAITIEFWTKILGSTFETSAGLVVKMAGGNDGYMVRQSADGFTWITNGGLQIYFSTQSTYSVNTWYHVVCTYDKDAGSDNAKIYVDGILDNTDTDTAAIVANNEDIMLGSYSTFYSNAIIDEVRIYNRALSADEIRYHYNRGAPVAHWKFDEGNGTTTYDSTNNGNDGQFMTAASSPTWTTGKYGTALHFDGIDDGVDCGTGASLDITDVITLGTWIKPVNTTEATVRPIFAKGTHNTGTYYLDSYDGNFRWHIGDSGLSNAVSAVLYENKWTYVAITAESGVAKFYVNGALEQTSTYTSISTTSYSFTIGKRSAVAAFFNGSIDDVRIYNYARTPSQIQQDYNEGAAARFGPTGLGLASTDCDNDPASCMDYGLVGYWNFDEGGGTTTNDGSDYSNHGQFMTAASSPRWTTGIKPLSGGVSGGGALQFDGKNDTISVADDDILEASTSDYSIEAWIKLNATNKYQTIVSKRDYPDSPYGYIDFRVSNTNKLEVYFDANGAQVQLTTGLTSLVVDRWYHVVWVEDRDGNSTLYLDGVVDKSQANTITNSVASANPLYVGSDKGIAAYFNGLIDDVRIYNRALSATEVRYHYNRGGPVAHWRFDEGEGTTTYDGTPNDNDGQFMTAASSPTWVQGKYGTALSFDGTDDYVDCGNDSSLTIADEITISAWIKPNLLNTWQYYVSKQWKYSIGQANNNLFYAVLAKTGENNINAHSSTYAEIGKWYHIAMTYDSGNTTSGTKLYVNGILEGTSVTFGALETSAQDLYLGVSSASLGDKFNGSMDDVRIYNYARTPEQISQDYNAGLSAHFQ